MKYFYSSDVFCYLIGRRGGGGGGGPDVCDGGERPRQPRGVGGRRRHEEVV